MARRKRLNPRRRHKCGKPVLEPRGSVVTPELLDQRRRIAPGLEDSKLMDQRAGIALDILLTNGSIDRAQRDAGEQYGGLVLRWRSLTGVPDGTRQPVAVPEGMEADPSKVAQATRQLAAANRRLAECSPMTRVVIESVCVDEVLGRTTDRTPVGERLREALKAGLDVLCDEFKIPRRQAAA